MDIKIVTLCKECGAEKKHTLNDTTHITNGGQITLDVSRCEDCHECLMQEIQEGQEIAESREV